MKKTFVMAAKNIWCWLRSGPIIWVYDLAIIGCSFFALLGGFIWMNFHPLSHFTLGLAMLSWLILFTNSVHYARSKQGKAQFTNTSSLVGVVSLLLLLVSTCINVAHSGNYLPALVWIGSFIGIAVLLFFADFVEARRKKLAHYC